MVTGTVKEFRIRLNWNTTEHTGISSLRVLVAWFIAHAFIPLVYTLMIIMCMHDNRAYMDSLEGFKNSRGMIGADHTHFAQ